MIASKFLGALILISVVLMGCSKQTGQSEADKNSNPVVIVKTARVSTGTLPVTVTLPGRTESRSEKRTIAPISGRVVYLKVSPGDGLDSGIVVARIRSKESQAAIDGAASLYRTARTPEQRQAAAQAIRLADSTQTVVDVFAGDRGLVASRGVNEGEYISEGAELLSVIDPATIEFTVDAPIRDLSALRVGQVASIELMGITLPSLPASIHSLDPAADAQSQTSPVHLRFGSLPPATENLLRTGLTGTARITIGSHQGVLLVPKAALLRNDADNSFSIVTTTADSLAFIHRVEVGIAFDSLVEVSGEGLHDGMIVIIEGHYALADSTRVRFDNGSGQ